MWCDSAAFLILVRRKLHATFTGLENKMRSPSLLCPASPAALSSALLETLIPITGPSPCQLTGCAITVALLMLYTHFLCAHIAPSLQDGLLHPQPCSICWQRRNESLDSQCQRRAEVCKLQSRSARFCWCVDFLIPFTVHMPQISLLSDRGLG